MSLERIQNRKVYSCLLRTRGLCGKILKEGAFVAQAILLPNTFPDTVSVRDEIQAFASRITFIAPRQGEGYADFLRVNLSSGRSLDLHLRCSPLEEIAKREMEVLSEDNPEIVVFAQELTRITEARRTGFFSRFSSGPIMEESPITMADIVSGSTSQERVSVLMYMNYIKPSYSVAAGDRPGWFLKGIIVLPQSSWSGVVGQFVENPNDLHAVFSWFFPRYGGVVQHYLSRNGTVKFISGNLRDRVFTPTVEGSIETYSPLDFFPAG